MAKLTDAASLDAGRENRTRDPGARSMGRAATSSHGYTIPNNADRKQYLLIVVLDQEHPYNFPGREGPQAGPDQPHFRGILHLEGR